MKSYVLVQVDCDGMYALISHYGEHINSSMKNETDVFYWSINRIALLLKRFNLRATFFVVGKDLETPENVDILKEIVLDGHEISNHTYTHPNNFSKMSDINKKKEIEKANRIIYQKLGVISKGFRAPNFDINVNILNTLCESGITYDCSYLYTPWKPLLRIMKGLNPITSSYLGGINAMPQVYGITEIPVSTFPYLKFPCNLSYMLALPETISYKYFEFLYQYYLSKNKPLILILHLSDFVDNEYLFKTELKYFKSLQKRLFFVENIFRILSTQFNSVTTIDYINKTLV